MALVVPSQAVTPESPEVRELIGKGLGYLENNSDTRLGGQCLTALAFFKDGASLDHPRIVEAVKACQKSSSKPRDENVYSNGLAIIFLCELNDPKHKEMIRSFAGALSARQKKHGGWGYDNLQTGDTSQTQYAVLSYWELMRVGITPSVSSVDAVANWLLRTQDPSGVWGYQGKDPRNFDRVEQDETSSSMLVAGLGSVMMAGNVLGLLSTSQQEIVEQENLPEALRKKQTAREKKMRTLSGSKVDKTKLLQAIDRGTTWFNKNFEYAEGEYPCYELYSLERYKSFEELLTGDAPEEPDWYQKGYRYLKSKIDKDGSWNGAAGRAPATGFAVLFLLRSTQKSIQASLGEGTLVGGRGLSADLNQMKMRNGRLVAEAKPTDVDKLLNMLEGDGSGNLDALLKSPASLKMDNVGPEDARRLQLLVKSGGPESRILAVRALGRMRDLDYVPIMLYAMTDPDQRVVREARDGLRLVSRRFQGFGLKDNFSDTERFEVLDRWKRWYRRIRPDAPPVP